MRNDVNTFLDITKSDRINILFPVPEEFKNYVVYTRILLDYSKAFFYNSKFELICIVERSQNNHEKGNKK